MVDPLLKRIDSVLIPSKAIDKYDNEDFDDKIVPVSGFRNDLIESLFGEKKQTGRKLPWLTMDDRFEVRPGELTLWGGVNGHGKSLLLGQVELDAIIKHDAKVAIASLELHPTETLKRMAAQFATVEIPSLSRTIVNQFLDQTENNLWLYSETGDLTPKRVIAMAKYVRYELGVDDLVIDSMMKTGTTDGDYAAEKRLVNSLQNICKQSGLHIHLVAHMRKKENEYDQVGKMDFHGSSMLTNVADSVLVVARNKKKEAEGRKAEPRSEIMSQPDTYLRCEKQRHGTGWEGVAGLFFHKCGQFIGSDMRGRAIDYHEQ